MDEVPNPKSQIEPPVSPPVDNPPIESDVPSKKRVLVVGVILVVLLVIAVVLTGLLYYFAMSDSQNGPSLATPTPTNGGLINFEGDELKTFASAEMFKEYLEESSELSGGGGFAAMGVIGAVPPAMMVEDVSNVPLGAAESQTTFRGYSGEPGRVSETNVQVKGIDEPDIVKTDGRELFISREGYYYGIREPLPLMESEEGILPPELPPQSTQVVTAFPPQSIEKISTIERQGELLLYENVLVVFSGDVIFGFDVSNPQEPVELWQMELDDSSTLNTARLYNGTVYLITQTRIDRSNPCPITPLVMGEQQLVIPCSDIYYPSRPVPVDVTYNVIELDPKSGEAGKQVSFVGSGGQSVVYVSPNNVYVTYTYPGDFVAFYANFFTSEASDLVDDWVIERLETLKTYDLSSSTKLMELMTVLEEYQQSLSDDERLQFENELANRMEAYAKSHGRDLQATGIVKVGLNDLEVKATGTVPGTPLNQFSLDEYEDHLRIATTVGQGMFGVGESANDVYVLDSELMTAGAVTDLGLDERIYSARFIGDRGYVVTFRQIDPFYVLDLSNPSNPRMTGELKIPGFSSYLHPLREHMILGVGEEDGQVKLSMFDVNDPSNPTEVSKYVLDEYWSEAGSNHHAFLQDDKFQVFFIPGGRGGYVFSYERDELAMKKAVSDMGVKRAVFIDDYLYIVGDQKIVVLDENNWEQIGQLIL